MRDFINNYWENSGFTLNLKPWCDNLKIAISGFLFILKEHEIAEKD